MGWYRESDGPFGSDLGGLRHFEGLSNMEVASLLGIVASAASRRYVRALARMQEKLRFAQGRGDGGPR